MEGINLDHWLFMFFVFTFIGWVHETTVESLYHRKFINRGSLRGPYIPIYGFGGCLIILCSYPFRANGFFVFLSGMIGCTILEYFTGFLMEKLFKRQFWDYSMMKFTYKNRISLLSSLCWGLLSLFMIYMLFPFMKWLGFALGGTFMMIFDCVMLFVFSVDIIITVNIIERWRHLRSKLTHEQLKNLFFENRRRVGRIFGHFTAALRREKVEEDFNVIVISDDTDEITPLHEIDTKGKA